MFDTELLISEPARYVPIILSITPIALISISFLFKLGPGKSSGQVVVTRPPGIVFGIVWLLIAILWFFALFIAALNLDTTGLILVTIFSFFAILGCTIWVMFYRKNIAKAANFALMFTLLWVFMSVVSSMTSPNSLDSYANTTISLLQTPILVWLSIALLLGSLELQYK